MSPVLSRARGALFATVLVSSASSGAAQEIAQYPTPANAPPRPLDERPKPQTSHEHAGAAQAPEAATPSPPNEAASGAEGTPAPDAEPTPSEPSELELNVQTTQEDLQGVRTDLENFKFQWQRERDLHTAITTRYLKIGGVVQARFGFQDSALTNANVYKRKSSFDINSAILQLQGTLYKDYEEGRNLTYNIRFGVSKQTNTNNSFLNLLDAQITYNFLPTINPEDPLLTATIGQQQLPFGLEVPATEELRPVIRNAQFTTSLDLVRRELGLIVRGELFPLVDFGYNYRVPVISYAFGVVNGAGPNTLDNNNSKDFVGRVAFTVPSDFNSWLRQLSIGGSVYLGRQNVIVTDKDKKSTLIGTGHQNRYGVDVYYNHWPFGLTYEYIRADELVATGTTPQAPLRQDLKRDSHTATLFLSFGEQFVTAFRNQGRLDDWWPKTYQPFLRYDRFNNNLEKSKADVSVYTAGFNLFLAETTKFQFNYNVTDTRANKDRITHEVLTQAQFGF